MDSTPTTLAARAATRHVTAYLRRPHEPRAPLTLDTTSAGVTPGDTVGEDIAREGKAIDALARELLRRGALAAEEADLIVDVARGEATADDLRDYRVLTRQSRCGLG